MRRREAVLLWLIFTYAALIWLYAWGDASLTVRRFSALAEGGGLAALLVGLLRGRVLHGGRRPLRAELAAWLRKLRRKLTGARKGTTLTTSATISAGVGVTAGGVSLRKRGGTVEERLNQLEQLTKELRADLKKERLERKAAVIEAVGKERKERLRVERELRQALVRLAVGDIVLQLYGIAWFLTGLVAEALPSVFIGILMVPY